MVKDYSGQERSSNLSLSHEKCTSGMVLRKGMLIDHGVIRDKKHNTSNHIKDKPHR